MKWEVTKDGGRFDVLYESSGVITDADFSITLPKPVSLYSKLGFSVMFDVGDTNQIQYYEVDCAILLSYTTNTLQWGYLNTSQRVGWLQATSVNVIEGHCYGTHTIMKIVGIL